MKRTMKYITVLLIALLSFSFMCPKNKLKKAIVGTWINSGYEESSLLLNKSDSLSDNAPGLQFQKNGVLIKRQNAGWCGTPPITYSNNEGTWEMLNDSTIRIAYSYWRGPVEEDLWIQSIDNSNLKFEIIASRNVDEKK